MADGTRDTVKRSSSESGRFREEKEEILAGKRKKWRRTEKMEGPLASYSQGRSALYVRAGKAGLG